MKHLCSIYMVVMLALLAAPVAASGEDPPGDPPSVAGSVSGDRGPLVGAHVMVKGTVVRAIVDENGDFQLPTLQPGEYVLQARAVGYTMAETTINVSSDSTTQVSFELEPMVVALDAITITGTMKEAFVSESPVTVKVVPIERLGRMTTSNLMESLEQVTGLYKQVDCAVCGTTNIRINGMEGVHTAFLIDGMPIMGSLASVYGLNGINPAIVEQVEVIKGPSSTLYGSEALAGVVNVITKDARFAPSFAINAFGTSNQEVNADVAVATGTANTHAMLSGNVTYMNHFMDDIADGFADVPIGGRGAVFGKIEHYGRTKKRFGMAAKYYYEDRMGGTEAFDRSMRGNAEVYGESIYTNRFEVTSSYRPPTPEENLEFQLSYAYHNQDSYYGDTQYDALQHIGYFNVLWNTRLGTQNDLLIGGTLRYDSYDDNTGATPERDNRFTPGIFAQNKFRVTADLDLLGGVRLDHHGEHGVIFSPRAAIKWAATGNTTFRLNGGTGFRVVHLFTEDHAAFHGHRELVIDEGLRPERTRNVTLNLNQALRMGRNPMVVDLDVFYTHFNNQIVHDYDRSPNELHYYNVDGYSISRGAALTLNQAFEHLPLTYTVGFTYEDVYYMDGGVKERQFYAADFMGSWSASYDLGGSVKLDYTASLTGPMRLPRYDAPFERDTESPVYTVHNLQANLNPRPGFELYGGVKNIFNYTQVSPLIDPTDPFGDNFDTAYVYGPMQGRRFLVGMRMTRGR